MGYENDAFYDGGGQVPQTGLGGPRLSRSRQRKMARCKPVEGGRYALRGVDLLALRHGVSGGRRMRSIDGGIIWINDTPDGLRYTGVCFGLQ